MDMIKKRRSRQRDLGRQKTSHLILFEFGIPGHFHLGAGGRPGPQGHAQGHRRHARNPDGMPVRRLEHIRIGKANLRIGRGKGTDLDLDFGRPDERRSPVGGLLLGRDRVPPIKALRPGSIGLDNPRKTRVVHGRPVRQGRRLDDAGLYGQEGLVHRETIPKGPELGPTLRKGLGRPEVGPLVDEKILDLERRLPFEEIGEADGGPGPTKAGRENPAKGDALLATGVPQTGGVAVHKNQEIGGAAVKLGPDEEFIFFKNGLGSVTREVDLQAPAQKRDSAKQGFDRLDVIFIQAIETRTGCGLGKLRS